MRLTLVDKEERISYTKRERNGILRGEHDGRPQKYYVSRIPAIMQVHKMSGNSHKVANSGWKQQVSAIKWRNIFEKRRSNKIIRAVSTIRNVPETSSTTQYWRRLPRTLAVVRR